MPGSDADDTPPIVRRRRPSTWPRRSDRRRPPRRSRHGPRGALVVAGISVALLFIGWLAFYFLLFMPRGSVG